MKNSIGSLAALAALAVPAALATPLPPEAADFSHVAINLEDTTQINLDIDGDGTNDFFVYGNFGSGIRVGVLNGTLRSGPLGYGTLFSPDDPTLTGGDFVVFDTDPSTYLGFSFATGGETHAAWVLFDAHSAAPMVVGGGWQPVPTLGVVVGEPSPVPEPSSFAALAGAAVFAGALAQRRRRAPASA